MQRAKERKRDDCVLFCFALHRSSVSNAIEENTKRIDCELEKKRVEPHVYGCSNNSKMYTQTNATLNFWTSQEAFAYLPACLTAFASIAATTHAFAAQLTIDDDSVEKVVI